MDILFRRYDIVLWHSVIDFNIARSIPVLYGNSKVKDFELIAVDSVLY